MLSLINPSVACEQVPKWNGGVGGGGGKSANLVLRVLSEPSVTVGEKKGQGKNYQMNDDVTSSEFDRYNYVINTY